MADADIIDSAYQDLAKSIATNFLTTYMGAASDQDRSVAKNQFINGFNAIRQANAVAHQLLPPL